MMQAPIWLFEFLPLPRNKRNNSGELTRAMNLIRNEEIRRQE